MSRQRSPADRPIAAAATVAAVGHHQSHNSDQPSDDLFFSQKSVQLSQFMQEKPQSSQSPFSRNPQQQQQQQQQQQLKQSNKQQLQQSRQSASQPRFTPQQKKLSQQPQLQQPKQTTSKHQNPQKKQSIQVDVRMTNSIRFNSRESVRVQFGSPNKRDSTASPDMKSSMSNSNTQQARLQSCIHKVTDLQVALNVFSNLNSSEKRESQAVVAFNIPERTSIFQPRGARSLKRIDQESQFESTHNPLGSFAETISSQESESECTVMSSSSQLASSLLETNSNVQDEQNDRRGGLRIVAFAGSVGGGASGKSENFNASSMNRSNNFQKGSPSSNNMAGYGAKQPMKKRTYFNSSERKLPSYKLQGEPVSKETFFAFRSITPSTASAASQSSSRSTTAASNNLPHATTNSPKQQQQQQPQQQQQQHSAQPMSEGKSSTFSQSRRNHLVSPSHLSLSLNQQSCMIALSKKDQECGRELTRLAREGLVDEETVEEMESLKKDILEVDAKIVTVPPLLHATTQTTKNNKDASSIQPKEKQSQKQQQHIRVLVSSASGDSQTFQRGKRHEARSVSPTQKGKTTTTKLKDSSAPSSQQSIPSKDKRTRAQTTTVKQIQSKPVVTRSNSPKSLIEPSTTMISLNQNQQQKRTITQSSASTGRIVQLNQKQQQQDQSNKSLQPIDSKVTTIPVAHATAAVTSEAKKKKKLATEPAIKRAVIEESATALAATVTSAETKAQERLHSPAENILENYLLGMRALDKQFARNEESKKGEIVFNNQYLKVLQCSAQIKKPIEIDDSSFVSLALYPLAYAAYVCSLQTRSLPLFFELILESGDLEVFAGRNENPNWDSNDFFQCQFDQPMKINYSRGELKGNRVYICIFSKKQSKFAFRISPEASTSITATYRTFQQLQHQQQQQQQPGSNKHIDGGQNSHSKKSPKQSPPAPVVNFNKLHREKLAKERITSKENHIMQMKQIEPRLILVPKNNKQSPLLDPRPSTTPAPQNGKSPLGSPPKSQSKPSTPIPRQVSPAEKAELLEKQRKEQQIRVIRAAYNSKKIEMETMNKTILRIQRKEDSDCRNPTRLERELRLLKQCFQTRWLEILCLIHLAKVLQLKVKAHKVKVRRTLHATGPLRKLNTLMMTFMQRTLGQTQIARTLSRTLFCLRPRIAATYSIFEEQATNLAGEVLVQQCKIILLKKKMTEFYRQITHIQNTHRSVMAERAEMMKMNRKNWDTALAIMCEDERKFYEKNWIPKTSISDSKRRIEKKKEVAIATFIKETQRTQVDRIREYKQKLTRISRVHQIAYVFCARILHNYFMKLHLRNVQESYTAALMIAQPPATKKPYAYYIETFKAMTKINLYAIPHKNPITAYENEKLKSSTEGTKKKVTSKSVNNNKDNNNNNNNNKEDPEQASKKSQALPTTSLTSAAVTGNAAMTTTASASQHNNDENQTTSIIQDQPSPISSSSSIGSASQIEDQQKNDNIRFSSSSAGLKDQIKKINSNDSNAPTLAVAPEQTFQEYLEDEEKALLLQQQQYQKEIPQIKVIKDPLERQEGSSTKNIEFQQDLSTIIEQKEHEPNSQIAEQKIIARLIAQSNSGESDLELDASQDGGEAMENKTHRKDSQKLKENRRTSTANKLVQTAPKKSIVESTFRKQSVQSSRNSIASSSSSPNRTSVRLSVNATRQTNTNNLATQANNNNNNNSSSKNLTLKKKQTKKYESEGNGEENENSDDSENQEEVLSDVESDNNNSSLKRGSKQVTEPSPQPRPSRLDYSAYRKSIKRGTSNSSKIFLSVEDQQLNSNQQNGSDASKKVRREKKSIFQSITKPIHFESQQNGMHSNEFASSSKNSSSNSLGNHSGQTSPRQPSSIHNYESQQKGAADRKNSLGLQSSQGQQGNDAKATGSPTSSQPWLAIQRTKLQLKPKKKKPKKTKLTKSDAGKLEAIVEGDETSMTFWTNFIHYPIFTFCPTLSEMKELIVKTQKKL